MGQLRHDTRKGGRVYARAVAVRGAGEEVTGPIPRARPTCSRRGPSSVVGPLRAGPPHDQRRGRAIPVLLCVVGVFRATLLQGGADADEEEDRALTGDSIAWLPV